MTVIKYGKIKRNDGIYIGYQEYFYFFRVTYFWEQKTRTNIETHKHDAFVGDQFCTDVRKEKSWSDNDSPDDLYLIPAQNFATVKSVGIKTAYDNFIPPENGANGFVVLEETTFPEVPYLVSDESGYVYFCEKFKLGDKTPSKPISDEK